MVTYFAGKPHAHWPLGQRNCPFPKKAIIHTRHYNTLFWKNEIDFLCICWRAKTGSFFLVINRLTWNEIPIKTTLSACMLSFLVPKGHFSVQHFSCNLSMHSNAMLLLKIKYWNDFLCTYVPEPEMYFVFITASFSHTCN